LNCNEARPLVQAYVDDELDLTGSLDVERHVAECAVCRHEYEGQWALRQALTDAPLYYQAPAELRRRVQAAVHQEERTAVSGRARSLAGTQAGNSVLARDRSAMSGRDSVLAPRGLLYRWLGLAAALILVACLGWGVGRYQASTAQPDTIGQEVLASSLRSMMAGPLTDVQSSDQHTVKPWFAGKLDFSPTVRDFTVQGFPLTGGRLDYIGSRPVAALVYRHQQHVINLYTWPAQAAADTPVQQHGYQGYHVFSWTQGGMNYWAASDMDAGELEQFAQLVRQG
jgi:anti-sigma factor RsiW